MKINLEFGNGPVLNSHVNVNSQPIDPSRFNNQEKFALANFNKLDNVCQNNEVKELIFNPPLNVINPNDLVNTLRHWCEKLQQKGILKVWIIDTRKVGLGLHNNGLDLQNAHLLIYGENGELKSILDTQTIIGIAKGLGLQVNFIAPVQFYVTFELEKN